MAQDRDRAKTEEGARRTDGISDLIKGAISTGVKSVLTTEEGVRGVLADFVPKEVSALVRTQLDVVKKELYSTVVGEFTSFLKRVDLASELKEVLKGLKMKVKVEIEFIDKPDEPKSNRKR